MLIYGVWVVKEILDESQCRPSVRMFRPALHLTLVSSESPGSESDCKAEQGDRGGGKTGEAKIVAAEQGKVVVECPDCTEAVTTGVGLVAALGSS